ncbi:unnamed protein product [Gongylonema pulchrum]|uniref:Nbl1_Borealin_N domain-containing protein n=1 Tax=Gongylonema pulchrum TaxID=637853 RepID=A0A183DT05_9BILA|nr:unnamed protein product [Gongylonema pulchrum]
MCESRKERKTARVGVWKRKDREKGRREAEPWMLSGVAKRPVSMESKLPPQLKPPHPCENDMKAFITALPKSVKRRVQALKKLQAEGISIESQFYERVHQLEAEFAPLFNDLSSKVAHLHFTKSLDFSFS